MRAIRLFALLILGAAALAIAPAITTGQFQPGGARPGGGKSGFMFSQDPNALFDFMARDRNYFLISEVRMRSMSEALTKYAQDKGITNGQITRQVFLDYQEQRKKQLSDAGGLPPAPGGGFKGFGGGKKFGGDAAAPAGPPGTTLTPELINAMADLEFQKRDKNGDGYLNQDEMGPTLRGNLAKYDKNGDGMIDRAEYREYFAARMQGAEDGGNPRGPAAIINDEEELDRKPTVYRAGGKMPPGLPPWFKDLDTDGDGQVALYEWRKAGKSIDDFKAWDANDDGFISPEEAVKHQATLTAKTSNGSSPGVASISSSSDNGGRPAFGSDKKNGKGGGGFRDFFKKKKDGGQ